MAAKKKAKKIVATKKKAAPARKAAKKRAPARGAKAAKPVANQVVHWEIQAKDPGALQRFYRDLFGWAIDANNPMSYGMVSSGGKDGIDGGIGGSPHGESKVTVYTAVRDINSTLAKAEKLGGKTVMPRQDIGPVIMALYTDPEGNLMGLLED